MKKKNEHFICVGCQKDIEPAQKTCRNHCPHCFVSLHVDGDVPGDRASTCSGRMYPIAYQYKTEGSRLLFQCDTCGKQHRNKQAIDDEIQNIDSYIQKYKKIIDG